VHGLLAMMLLNDSRRDARFRDGELVLLGDQDRSRWDPGQIAAGRAERRFLERRLTELAGIATQMPLRCPAPQLTCPLG
jgi:predicted RNA polymerase sigma factor